MYVRIPRINFVLTLFKNGWNKHENRTKHASSPEQLFVAGALQLQNSGMVAVDFSDNVQQILVFQGGFWHALY